MNSPWRRSWRAQPKAAAIADRHYNRQKPGSPQFVPPGSCLALLTADRSAVWVTSWPKAKFVQHAWAGAWVNSLFRLERDPGEPGPLASDLIRWAVAHTRARWPEVPALGMVTFINPDKVRHKRDPGRCYRKAGFKVAGKTKGGLVVLQMTPDSMPSSEPIPGDQLTLWGVA